MDPDRLGLVTGEVAGLTFEKSGLDSQTLYQIWELADSQNNGFLRQLDFIRAMRLIGHVQSGKALSPTLADTPAPHPTFKGLHFSLSPSSTGQTAGSGGGQVKSTPIQPQFSNSSINNTQLPPISANEISKFIQLFNRHVPASLSFIGGIEAREIFLKAKLPETILGLIWNLADKGGKGSLTKDEFCLAMFLIQSLLKGTLKQVPSSIPDAIWSQISQILISINYGNSAQVSSLPQQSTGNLLGLTSDPTPRKSSIPPPPPEPRAQQFAQLPVASSSSPLQPQHSASQRPSISRSQWTVTSQQKQQFDQIFNSLDKEGKGALGPGEVAPFLLSSKLSQEDLALVWDLSDVNNTGEFTKVEFAISMFLVQKKLRGETLPSVVPVELLESLKNGSNSVASPNPPTLPAKIPEQHTATAGPSSSGIPAAVPPQQTQSSLNDLVDIFGTASSQQNTGSSPVNKNIEPSTVAPQRSNSLHVNSTGNSLTSHDSLSRSVTGARKFKPTSSFGQKIIQEQIEKEQKKSSLLQLDENKEEEEDSGDDSDISYSYKPNRSNEGHSAAVPPPIPTSSKPNYDALRDLNTGSPQPQYHAQSSIPPPPAAARSSFISNSSREIQPQPQQQQQQQQQPQQHQSPSDSAELAQLNNDFNNVNNQITAEHVAVGNIGSQIKSVESQVTELKEKIANAKKQLAAVQEAKITYESRLTQVRALLEEETEQYESIKKSVVESQQENESLRQKSSLLEAEYNNHQSEYQSYQAQLTEKQNENSVYRERLGTLTGQNNDLVKQLESIQKALQEQKAFNNVQERQIEVLKTKNVSLTGDIQGVQKEFDEAKSVGSQKTRDLETAKAASQTTSAPQAQEKSVNNEAEVPAPTSRNVTDEDANKPVSSVIGTSTDVAAGAAAAVGGAIGTGLHKLAGDDNDSGRSTPVKRNNPFLAGFSGASNQNNGNSKSSTEELSNNFNREFHSESRQFTDAGFPSSNEDNEVRTPSSNTHESGDDINDVDAFNNFTEFPSQADFESRFNDEHLKSPTNTEKATTITTKGTPDTSPPASDFQFGMPNTALQLPPYGITRPESLTSSVQNNAPLSIRGDIDDSAPDSPARTIDEPVRPPDSSNVFGNDSHQGEQVPTSSLAADASHALYPISGNTDSTQDNNEDWFDDHSAAPKSTSEETAHEEDLLPRVQDLNIRTNSITSVNSDEFTDAREDLISPTAATLAEKSNKNNATITNVINNGSKQNFDTFDAAFDDLSPAGHENGDVHDFTDSSNGNYSAPEAHSSNSPFGLDNKSVSTLLANKGLQPAHFVEPDSTTGTTGAVGGAAATAAGVATGAVTAAAAGVASVAGTAAAAFSGDSNGDKKESKDKQIDDFDAAFDDFTPVNETPKKSNYAGESELDTIRKSHDFDDFDAAFDDLSPAVNDTKVDDEFENTGFTGQDFTTSEAKSGVTKGDHQQQPHDDFDSAFDQLSPAEQVKSDGLDDFDYDFDNLTALPDKSDSKFDDEFDDFDSHFPDLSQQKKSGNGQASTKNDNDEFDSAFNI